MANIDNLRPCEYKLSQEEAKRGGIASGEARRQKKSLREKAKLLMSLSVKDQQDLSKAKELGLNTEDIDIEMMNLIHMLNIIKKENFNSVGAFNSIKDLTEEKTDTNETPQVQINIVDNSNLEKVMYEDNDTEDTTDNK
jgi:hypothetical protein